MQRSLLLAVFVAVAVANRLVHGQAGARLYVAGQVAVTTSDSLRSTVVRGKGFVVQQESGARGEEIDFVFCVRHAEPISKGLNYTGGARLVYKPLADLTPRHATAREQIVPALALLKADGEAWFFQSKGQLPLHPPLERSVGKSSSFEVVTVTRQDWRDAAGRRRGTDPARCLKDP